MKKIEKSADVAQSSDNTTPVRRSRTPRGPEESEQLTHRLKIEEHGSPKTGQDGLSKEKKNASEPRRSEDVSDGRSEKHSESKDLPREEDDQGEDQKVRDEDQNTELHKSHGALERESNQSLHERAKKLAIAVTPKKRE